jgi:hypothetical protein
VDIDRIVHQTVKPAGLDLDESAAIRNLDPIVMSGKDFAARRRDGLVMPKRDVLGILGQQSQSGAVKQIDVLDGGVFAIDDEETGMVAFAVAQNEDIPRRGPPPEAVVEPNAAPLEFLGPVVVPIRPQAALVASFLNDPAGLCRRIPWYPTRRSSTLRPQRRACRRR